MNISTFIEKNVYCNQTLLVTLMLVFNNLEDQICNATYTNEDGDRVEKEIYEWWIVSDWLLGQLESFGEPVLKDQNSSWWGRCCTGQAIANNTVIQEIFQQYCITDHQ